ncbi:hypothetical protein IC582_014435 [Cucumis melo]
MLVDFLPLELQRWRSSFRCLVDYLSLLKLRYRLPVRVSSWA